MSDTPKLLLDSFQAVIEAVNPKHFIKNHVPSEPKGRLIVVGAGKASALMAAAFEDSYNGKIEGIVVTRYGYAVNTRHIKIMEAAHPVPDEAGQKAANEMITLLQTANEDDLVICLISGGGSAFLSAPVEGVSFEELQDLNSELLKCGAGIHEINTVRKHLNIALGGGLAQAASKAKMITLSISDVVGDDPSTIASGATVPDATTLQDALTVLDKYDIQANENILSALKNHNNETPKPDDGIFDGNEYHIVASARTALDAATAFWEDQGFNVHILDADVEKDTNKAARDHMQFLQEQQDLTSPCAILSGGETTVTVSGNGKGGPNTQFMLQAALLLNGRDKIYGLACDTDGIDGIGDHAGAFITPDTLQLAQETAISPEQCLAENNSYAFFEKTGQLVKTGPTFTNVNDYRVFLLWP